MTPIGPEVAAEMVDVLADPGLYIFIGGDPPALAELEARYLTWAAGPSTPGETWHNWVIRLTDEGQAIGHLQATVIDNGRVADIAWVIGTPWQGRGFASEAAKALVAWLEAAGTTSITAHVHPGHAASGRVAANAGLTMTDAVVDGEIVWRRTAETSRPTSPQRSAGLIRTEEPWRGDE
jgi:RimJ/RimL family protein N-acetyltransferase